MYHCPILDIWQGSAGAAVFCYLLFGKVEDTNMIDSAAMLIYSFQNSNTITTYFTSFNSE